ncbi:MAG TPA: DUF302 domain-containing protein [Galbitalea sp.]
MSIPGSVAEAVTELTKMLEDRDLEVFAVIDYGVGAAKAGLQLGDEVVVLFGSPMVGTRLMQEDRRVGLDLPLRMLLWDDGGATQATYAAPRTLAANCDLHSSQVLDGMSALMESLVGELAAGKQ